MWISFFKQNFLWSKTEKQLFNVTAEMEIEPTVLIEPAVEINTQV